MTLEQVQEFEAAIRDVMSRFKLMFGDQNPAHLWRQGKIPRIGFLTPPQMDEYSFHGAGCTVEVNGRLVSFDFDGDDGFCYSAFKLGLFHDLPDWKEASDLLDELDARGELKTIPHCGARLKTHQDE